MLEQLEHWLHLKWRNGNVWATGDDSRARHDAITALVGPGRGETERLVAFAIAYLKSKGEPQ